MKIASTGSATGKESRYGLADEQQLAVLGERPGTVVHNLLKLVDRTAEGGEALGDLVVGDSLGIFVLKDIGLLASLDHRRGSLADLVNIFGDAVRYTVDHRHEMGQFILTGSAVPDKKAEENREHTGTGRFGWLTMRPMTLFESGESNGSVRLSDLFDNSRETILERNDLQLQDIAFLICRGGWPMAVGLPEEAALEQAFDYYDAVTKEDIVRVDGVKRTSERAQRLMRAYARHQGTQASNATLCEDLKNNDSASLNEDTISSYLGALRKIFVVEDMPAWNPNLRSKTSIRTADTRYFVDPSIAVAALGLGPHDLIKDLNTMGFFFEAMCIRDLRVFAEALNGKVYHYRDKTGLECDAVVHLRNGRYGLIEIKLGGESLIGAGAVTLNSLESRIDTAKMNPPSFKMVLTATGTYAYLRPEDNVYVVPVGCLKP